MANGTNGSNKWTPVNVMAVLIMTVFLAVQTWQVRMIIDYIQFKAAGTWFTAMDGVELRDDILAEVRELPQWVKNDLNFLKSAAIDADKRLDKIERRLLRNSASNGRKSSPASGG